MKLQKNYFWKMLCAILLLAGLVTACYDYSDVREQLRDHESRLKELERLTAQQNTNISSLQTIVTALQDKDYVTNVSPINEGDKVLGYTITFSKSGAVTIYNGKDGYVPVMGVKQEESDGQWYWTVDGEWLLDSKGDQVRASALDGEDGEPGTPGQPGVTPTLKIVDGYWYVSYDGGRTWEDETLGQATGDKGYTMFEKVEYDEEHLYITMADGEELVLPRKEVYAGENIVGPATVTIGKKTATSVTFDVHMDVPEEELHYCKVTIYYAESDDIFQISTVQSVCAPYVGDHGDDNSYFDENRNISIPVRQLSINNQYKYCVCVETKTGKFYSDIIDFTPGEVTMGLSVEDADIDYYSAVVKGVVTGVFPEDKPYWQSLYVRYRIEGSEYKDVSINIYDIPESNIVEFKLNNLLPGTTYTYMPYYGSGVSGVEKSFTTLKHPYDNQSDLDFSFAKDLSSPASANCYIISESGLYKYKAVKGNSNESVGSVASASILWETFGTDTAPEPLDLIGGVCYKDGYIAFQTADALKEGNAVIAAKDADGNILWSWHIWFTDQPQGQEYYNNAGTMMDRNLGATSATPGDVGALGLLYQWGRKDPFLGSSSISSSTVAKSTIPWPSDVSSDSSNGTIAYATANPTTFITDNSSNGDWYYTGSSSTDNTRWTTSEKDKSIYDPCPAGWRVPDGGRNGVWSKASGSSYFDYTYSRSNKGMNFSGKFGSASTIWYPASGFRYGSDGGLGTVGVNGYYWSASPNSNDSYDSNLAYHLYFNYDGEVDPSSYDTRASGLSVRCLQVIDEVAGANAKESK